MLTGGHINPRQYPKEWEIVKTLQRLRAESPADLRQALRHTIGIDAAAAFVDNFKVTSVKPGNCLSWLKGRNCTYAYRAIECPDCIKESDHAREVTFKNTDKWAFGSRLRQWGRKHPYRRMIVDRPYGLSVGYLKSLIEQTERLGLVFGVSNDSMHCPGGTIRVSIYELAEVREPVGKGSD